jgi:G2/mitotic-specific cyclin-B, other
MRNTDRLNFNQGLTQNSNLTLNQKRIFGKDITNKNIEAGFQVNSILNTRTNFLIPNLGSGVNNFLPSSQNMNLPDHSSSISKPILPSHPTREKILIRVNRAKNQSMDDNILKKTLNLKNPLLQQNYENNKNYSKPQIQIFGNQEGMKFKENINLKETVRSSQEILNPPMAEIKINSESQLFQPFQPLNKNNVFFQAKATIQNDKFSQIKEKNENLGSVNCKNYQGSTLNSQNSVLINVPYLKHPDLNQNQIQTIEIFNGKNKITKNHQNSSFPTSGSTLCHSLSTQSTIDNIIKNNLHLQNQRNSVKNKKCIDSGSDLKIKEKMQISNSDIGINLEDSNIHMKTVESDEKFEKEIKIKDFPGGHASFDVDETLKILEEEEDEKKYYGQKNNNNFNNDFSLTIDKNFEFTRNEIKNDEENLKLKKFQNLKSPRPQCKGANIYPENIPDLKYFKEFTFNNWKKIKVEVETTKRGISAPEEKNESKFNKNLQLENNLTHSCLYNPEPHLEYLDEIYSNLLQEESELNFKTDYLKYQTDLNDKMRIILMEWLYEVVIKFKLRLDTYFLTVYIIDQFLVKGVITRNHYQLLAASALLIACKFEEIYFPEIKDLVYICDKAFSEELILLMESEILKYLNFKIFPIFPERYLQIIAYKLNLSNFDMNFCLMMLELFTFDYKMINYPPSLIACTCVYIALKIKKFSAEECNEKIESFLNFSLMDKFEMEKQLKLCAQNICALLDNLDLKPFRMIKEKYSKTEFEKVAKFKISM